MEQVTVDTHRITNSHILERINLEVMNPIGFAIYYNAGSLVADDGVWEYSPELTNRILRDEEVATQIQQLLAQEEYIENTNS